MKTLVATLALATSAWAAVPGVLTFTGTLSEDGEAVADGEYAFQFRIFDAAAGGTQIWVEPLNLTTRAGVFTALLGAGSVPLDPMVFQDGMTWLEVEAAGDNLQPRLQMVSVPYAFLAESAQSAASLDCVGCIGAGHVDSAAVQQRVSGNCAGGESVAAVNADGSVTCVAGLALAGNGVATTAARTDHTHTGVYLPVGATVTCPGTEKVVALDPMTGNVFCGADEVAAYSAGPGIQVTGTSISTSFVGFSCANGESLTGFDALGDPTCAPPVLAAGTQLPRANTVAVVDATGSSGRSTSVTLGADGLPLISHYDAVGGDLRVVKCGDPSCVSSVSTLVDGATSTVGDFSSIAMGADGLPVVSYYDVGNGDLLVVKCGDAACSAGNGSAILDGAAADVGRFTAIAVGTDGLPVISYRDATNLDLKVAKCADAACAVPAAVATVDGAGTNVGEYSSIAIGADGLPVISYYDVGATNLKVAKCSDAACAAAATVTIVDGGGADLGRYTSITVPDDGLPIVAHYSASAGRLRAVKCTDAACTGASAAVVDASSNVGAHASITVGADGLPLIAYHDVTAGVLKVARCDNSACSAANTLSIVDANAVTGHYTSITIGADGLPFVAYREVTGDRLAVLHCANAFCLDRWSRR